ncbi:hypothetical protein [Planctomycetes bacterium CA13]|uniref:hypothetical protein n=1 Tax=Novipirellula herctigrandis TaxID=2527986 RepID=UPI0011B7E313
MAAVLADDESVDSRNKEAITLRVMQSDIRCTSSQALDRRNCFDNVFSGNRLISTQTFLVGLHHAERDGY